MQVTHSNRLKASRLVVSRRGVSMDEPAPVIAFPAPAYQQQTASDGFFLVVTALGLLGGALTFVGRWVGLL